MRMGFKIRLYKEEIDMKSLVRLRDYSKDDILRIFNIADELHSGEYAHFLSGKTVVMFFPDSSIRTRVAFEKMIADMYSLSKIRGDFLQDNYLFCGAKGNIGLAWKEAAEVMELSFSQCCPKGHEMDGISFCTDIDVAVINKDIICTDSFPKEDEEVTGDVIDSCYFVGYGFKKNLLEIQQAIILYNLMNG